MMPIKNLLNSIVAPCRRFFKGKPSNKANSDFKGTLFEEDDYYHRLFEYGLKLDGTPEYGRRERFYSMVQFYCSTSDLSGETAEAGCLFGLSSFLMCGYERLKNPQFKGNGHHLFDSFVDLSKPSPEDLTGSLSNPILSAVVERYAEGVPDETRHFLERTQNTLVEFPEIEYHKGWIPDIFRDHDERTYRFVHIDVDLFAPTFDSLAYFYPRLVTGGVIVVDDYGFVNWPGVKKAADRFCRSNKIPIIPLITGNAVIVKR